MKTLTAVLFAGGESRRMGQDKATLEIAGEPLWSRQSQLLRGLSPEKILVSARKKPGWLPEEIEIVLDEPPSRGPLSGLAAALKKIRTTHLLALAVDLPEMNFNHLRKLWSFANEDCGVVPRDGKCFEPLCAIYPASVREIAEAALAGDDVSLQSFIRTLAGENRVLVYPVPASEHALYRNANTVGELKSFAAGLSGIGAK